MANGKRLPSDDIAGPLPPRKSTRSATKAVASLTRPGDDDSSGPSKTVTPRPDGDDTLGPSKTDQNNGSQGKSLSRPAMGEEVMKMVENEDNAELMMLELMRRYAFSLTL